MEEHKEQTRVQQEDGDTSTSLSSVVMMAAGIALITVAGGWFIATTMSNQPGDDSSPVTPPTGTSIDDIIDDEDPNADLSRTEKREGCELVGGEFNEYDECLGINQQQCDTLDGVWGECGSACRNDPDAELCTQQCVQFCEL